MVAIFGGAEEVESQLGDFFGGDGLEEGVGGERFEHASGVEVYGGLGNVWWEVVDEGGVDEGKGGGDAPVDEVRGTSEDG